MSRFELIRDGQNNWLFDGDTGSLYLLKDGEWSLKAHPVTESEAREERDAHGSDYGPFIVPVGDNKTALIRSPGYGPPVWVPPNTILPVVGFDSVSGWVIEYDGEQFSIPEVHLGGNPRRFQWCGPEWGGDDE